uniref:Uncharacterized protein n=1 Tax=Arundo donax TaxID=35708 RepID=A0A0A9DBJ8_ARUDO
MRNLKILSICMARHDFIKLSGAEYKLQALLQVMETLINPSLLHTYIFLSLLTGVKLNGCYIKKKYLFGNFYEAKVIH